MKKTRASALVILLVIGLGISAIPITNMGAHAASTLGNGVALVYRDEWGVPHITAKDTGDVYYAMGYAMAQDRMFEMDLFRRATAGRLGEVFGDLMLSSDIEMRTLGIYKIANDTWNGLYPNVIVPPDVKADLQQFSNGTNDYIATLRAAVGQPNQFDVIPHEYTLLWLLTGLPLNDILPYNWTAQDSLSIAGYMGLSLTDTSGGEMTRGAFASNVDSVYAAPPYNLPNLTDFLMPTGWINMTTIMPPGCSPLGQEGFGGMQGITDSVNELLGLSGFAGSNNWVVNGSLTESGNAMLCNDPHLDLQFPGINWQVQARSEEFNVIGCAIPGGPVIYTGHNDRFAFGVTNLGADIVDMYYYVSNATHYWYVDHWEPFTVTYETIYNLTTPIILAVNSTIHGPIVETGMSPPFDKMAFRWAGREYGYGEVVGFSEMMRAKNLTEWRQSLTHMSVIIQNFVYADKEGNIAWSPSGAIPVRDPSNVAIPGGTLPPTYGSLPSNGSAGQNEWIIDPSTNKTFWIPRATSPAPLPSPWNNTYSDPISLPYCENPDQGFIATANNQPINSSYPGYPWPVWIGPACGFDPGYRGERITELIQSLAPLNITDMIAIQGDSLSIPAKIFVPIINDTMTGDANSTIIEALGYLNAWNFTELRNMVAPLIFEVWYDCYRDNTFCDNFEAFGLSSFPNMIIPLRYMTENPEDPYSVVLFDDNNTTPAVETMADIINASLHDAIDWIASKLGSDMSNWQYGKIHVVNFNHPLGEFVPKLNVPETPVGCDGGPYTVDPGGHYHNLVVTGGFGFVETGASYRGIYECKDGWDTSLILVPPGESGLVTGSPLGDPVFDPNCTNTFLMWLNNQYTPCLFIELVGDIDYDGDVDIFDLRKVGKAYGSAAVDDPETPWDETLNWNPEADLNDNGEIEIFDLRRCAKNYDKTWP